MDHSSKNLFRSKISGLLSRLVTIEKTEIQSVFWAAGYFFFLLCCLYLVRPLRWSLGVEKVVKPHIAWMFTLTLLIIMALNPVYGFLTSRVSRKQFIRWIYLFFVSTLVLFFIGFQFFRDWPWVSRGFFIWLSVLNLFIVSVFWDFLVDVFSPERGKRLFGFIAIFGTLGAIVGSFLATILGNQAFLLLLSGLMLLLAAFCANRLSQSSSQMDQQEILLEKMPPGKGSFAGIARVFSNPYLLLIGIYVLFSSVSGTLFYRFETEATSTYLTQKEVYLYGARQDLCVNFLTFFLQLGFSKRVIRFLGVGKTLALLPLVVVAGFLVLGFQFAPIVWWVFGIRVLSRVAEFSFVKPASKLLFTVVGREDKYSAQSFIDTFVYRLGDISTVWLVAGLLSSQVKFSLVFLWILPVWILWIGLSFLLEKKQRKLAILLEEKQFPKKSW